MEIACASPLDTRRDAVPKARWWRIIPPIVIVYIIAYMDRVNIGFAMAGGMNKALDMSATGSGLAAGIFFWGYLVLQVPGGHVAEHGSAKKFILWSILGWGVFSFLSGFAQNAWQMYAMRFLLGVAEGGVAPAIYVLLTKWFPQKELGRANGAFLVSLPLSAVITNPVSGWIIEYADWRWLFFVEGIVSLLLIFVWWPLIEDRPEDAKWLSQQERDYLVTTLAEERAQREAKLNAAGKGTSSYRAVLKDKNLWLMMVLYLCYISGNLGYIIWLPTILKQLTQMSLTNVGWLSAVPLAAGIAGVYMFGAMSDRKGNRRLWCALSVWGFGLSIMLSVLFPSSIWLSYTFIVLAGLFSKALMSPFWTIAPLVFPPGVAGGARGIINGVGNLGGFIGPVAVGFFSTLTGNMDYGCFGLAALLILSGLLAMLLPRVTAGYKYQN